MTKNLTQEEPGTKQQESTTSCQNTEIVIHDDIMTHIVVMMT